MSVQVPEAHVRAYNGQIAFLSQQDDSRFGMAVTTDTYTGDSGRVVDQLGPITLQSRASRHAPLPFQDTPHDARWVFPVDGSSRDFIDREDQLKSLINLSGGYATTNMMAFQRHKDLQIANAFFGDATTGGERTTTTVFPASQTIDAGGAAGMSAQKVLDAIELLKDANVDVMREELFMGLGARQWNELMIDADVKSIDTNATKPLATGILGRFLGVTYIDYTDFAIASSIRDTPLWAKSGMHYAMWGSIDSNVRPNVDRGNVQVDIQVLHGATRLEEVKVVKVRNLES